MFLFIEEQKKTETALCFDTVEQKQPCQKCSVNKKWWMRRESFDDIPIFFSKFKFKVINCFRCCFFLPNSKKDYVYFV
jgi:hypothetical protein